MATCATPTCVRPPANSGLLGKCIPCKLGHPPMTNSKSPHAAGNSKPKIPESAVKAPTTFKERPSGNNILTPVGLADSGIFSKPKGYTKSMDDKRKQFMLNKKAVELIFNTYWYGWKDGNPEVFTELFKKYGNFIHFSVKPSTMDGSPETHRGTINVQADAQGEMYLSMFNESGGRQRLMEIFGRTIRGPLVKTLIEDMTVTDAVAMFKNNKLDTTFTRKGDITSEVYTYDDNGTKREIARWAIA
jgi:hypothetical protein